MTSGRNDKKINWTTDAEEDDEININT